MRLAWFSPLNPQPSGISDYSAELLPELARHAEIDVWVDPSWKGMPGDTPCFRVRPYTAASFPAGDYDQVVYHVGNDYAAHRYMLAALERYPGVVVLHDLVLMGYYAAWLDAGRRFPAFTEFLKRYYPRKAAWIDALLAGRPPFALWEDELALQLPMNEEVCARATALIAHSRFVLDRLDLPPAMPRAVIPHHGHRPRQVDRGKVRRSLGVAAGELLAVSAGYVTPGKRYGAVLGALDGLGRPGLRYLIAGRDRDRLLERLGAVQRPGVLVRGFAPLDELEGWIAAADIGVNLRNPTMGESSGSLLRMLSNGLPTLVSDIGAFAELPDGCVVKVPADIDERETIRAALAALADDADLRRSLGREAAAYAREACGSERCARLYAEFLAGLPARPQEAP